MQKMQMLWAHTPDGGKALIIRFILKSNEDGTDDVVFYVITGDELFKFYGYVKDGMEGGGRRPGYLG